MTTEPVAQTDAGPQVCSLWQLVRYMLALGWRS